MIVRNRIRCKKCGTILESKSVHDFAACPCGVFTDGGHQYIRCGYPAGGGFDDWIEELHEFKEKPLLLETDTEQIVGGKISN